ETQLGASSGGWDAPLQKLIHRMVQPPPPPPLRRTSRLRQTNQPAAGNPVHIPQTHLPQGWDAPLQNAMPVMVPPPPPALRRANRLRQVNQSAAPAPVASASTRSLAGGPLYDISSGQADPALNNLTRADIAHREQQQALAALQE
ncbi:hypothetical protein C0993_011352, partial [Termitomyces sp. T159_Od127]